jgi:hypothetical protein
MRRRSTSSSRPAPHLPAPSVLPTSDGSHPGPHRSSIGGSEARRRSHRECPHDLFQRCRSPARIASQRHRSGARLPLPKPTDRPTPPTGRVGGVGVGRAEGQEALGAADGLSAAGALSLAAGALSLAAGGATLGAVTDDGLGVAEGLQAMTAPPTAAASPRDSRIRLSIRWGPPCARRQGSAPRGGHGGHARHGTGPRRTAAPDRSDRPLQPSRICAGDPTRDRSVGDGGRGAAKGRRAATTCNDGDTGGRLPRAPLRAADWDAAPASAAAVPTVTGRLMAGCPVPATSRRPAGRRDWSPIDDPAHNPHCHRAR